MSNFRRFAFVSAVLVLSLTAFASTASQAVQAPWFATPTDTRDFAQNYTNLTGNTIMVKVAIVALQSGVVCARSDASTQPGTIMECPTFQSGQQGSLTFLVPPNFTYRLNASPGFIVHSQWIEWMLQ